MSDNDFYIGYYPKASKKQGALLWKIVAGLLVFSGAVAVTLTMMQPDYPPSAFEFGVERDFEGIITEAPYPVLNIPRPDAETQMPGYSPYLLVVFGKSGAQQAVSGMDRKRVKLRGSLIYREGQTMIEIVDNSIELVSDAPATSLPALSREGENLGTHELQGEIVDSKCFLGVMNPGSFKLHKACATLCISGGIPPVFVVQDENNLATYFMLVSSDGKAVNQEVLPMIAAPLSIKGNVIKHGDLLILQADPATYKRL
ncbi:MAG: hypothetical protein ACRBF0_14120 [Calditrichia bacterium]